MPTESNTSSDLGPNAARKDPRTALIRDHKSHQSRVIGSESPHDRMIRVVQNVQRKKKKKGK